MSSPSLTSSYLPHINGLRAVAILAVLFYHLRADYCPAGYFGVDLFLIISGFLLFRSLLKPGAEQGFHYGNYLLKKAWRIIPSWFVVTALVCALSAWLMAPSRSEDIMRTAHYSAFFLADYRIDRSTDYFNVYSQQNPLLHYWYLSITQQIYLLAPLLVIPLLRWSSRRAAIILLAVLSALSLTYYILTTSTTLLSESARDALLHALDTKTAYYHLAPRLWELVAGFGVFLLPEFADRPKLRALLGLLGLGGIIASFYLYETGSPALYLTVVSSLLALRYGSTGPVARLLELRPVQAIGTISFSLYLWHWPIMVFWKYCVLDSFGVWHEVGAIALSLLLGALSWRFIESVKTPRREGWKGTLLRCSLLLLLPIVAVATKQMQKNISKQIAAENHDISPPRLSTTETDAEVLRGLESLRALNLKNPLLRLGAENQQPVFFLMGDSHARHISYYLHKACEAAGVRGLYLNNSVLSFYGLLVRQTPSDPLCWNQKLADTLLQHLEQHPSIRYILIAKRWEWRFVNMPEASIEATGENIPDRRERQQLAYAGLREWCKRLQAIGKQVILLEDNPTLPPPSPLDEWQRYQQVSLLQYIRPYRERILTAEEHEAGQKYSHRYLRQLAKDGLALTIDLAEGMKENGAYPVRSNGEFLYGDDNHFSDLGSRRAVDYLMPRLLNIMGRQQPEPSAP